MTAILIFIAVLIAAVLGIWLVIRSRDEPGGRSGVDPERTGDSGARLGDPKDVERLRQEDAEVPEDRG